MIENMRKYTGLMVVVLVLLAAGLILTMGDFRANTGGRQKITEVYGTAIDATEYKKLGRNSITAIKEINDPELSSYALDLIYNRNLGPYAHFGFSRTGSSPDDIRNFVNRRVVIAKTAADYGIYPSTQLAEKHIIENIFVKDGQFDGARYKETIKNLGSAGMQEEDFVNLIAESLVYKKLKSLVSSGLQSPNSLTDRASKFLQQTLDLTTIDISIDPYKAKINPTEEEISTYWKENDFNYLTDRKIRISYVVEQPIYSSPRPEAPVRKPETTGDEFEKLDEEYKKALATWEIDIENKANKRAAFAIDNLAYVIDESEGLRFSEEIEKARNTQDGDNKKIHAEFITTELFSSKNVSEELKNLKTDNGQSVADILFQTKISDSLQYRIPAPIRLEGDGWFYVRYDEEVNPVPMTYEQAKELAKADLIQKKAHEAMLAEVDQIKEKLTASITGGSSAEEAAKANELTALKRPGLTYQALSKDQRGQATATELEIFENASISNMKSFSENNVVSDSKITLVYLESRKVVNSTESVNQRVSFQKGRSQILQDSVFRAWMDDAIAKANIPAMPNQ